MSADRLMVELAVAEELRRLGTGLVRDRDVFEFGNDYWPFDNERDYRMDRPYELLDTWAAKQRDIARDLAR